MKKLFALILAVLMTISVGSLVGCSPDNNEGVTIVLVTHEPDIAEYAKRIITFKDGIIISDVLNENRK